MELSQVRRYLNQLVYYRLPTGELRQYRLLSCTLRKDRHTGDLHYSAELLDEKSGRSTLLVNLENIFTNK